MSVHPKPLSAKPAVAASGSDTAPIVYYDGVLAWGLLNGVVQVELAANHLMPVSLGENADVKTRTVVTAHLRCNLVAAQNLRDVLDAAIRRAMTPPDKAN